MCLFSPNTDALIPLRSRATPDRAPDRLAGGTPAALRDDLISLLGSAAVLSRVTDLVKYATDASPYRLFPQVVVAAESPEQIAKTLQYARQSHNAAFMEEMITLIVSKYDGSLKAEHGTGRNIAPFLEKEWGPKATALMWRIKKLFDPRGLLAPGVMLNKDPVGHLKNTHTYPEIESVANACIECGYCEPVCPSRHLTTTPRQRIALRREMLRHEPGSPIQNA